MRALRRTSSEKENLQEHHMSAKQPNIIVMYADDLGFGDFLQKKGLVSRRNWIAWPSRVRYTAYATAATCTSRYSLLTGSYPWRNLRGNFSRRCTTNYCQR